MQKSIPSTPESATLNNTKLPKQLITATVLFFKNEYITLSPRREIQGHVFVD